MRSVAAGVPGLWSTCRRQGLSRRDAAEVLRGSWYAVTEARRRFPRRPREQNAVRHLAWQAWLTARWGREVAAAIGAQHETVSLDPLDSRVDEANNRVAEDYGTTHAAELRALPTPTALAHLADAGARLWRRGELFMADGGRVVASRPR